MLRFSVLDSRLLGDGCKAGLAPAKCEPLLTLDSFGAACPVARTTITAGPSKSWRGTSPQRPNIRLGTNRLSKSEPGTPMVSRALSFGHERGAPFDEARTFFEASPARS